MIEKVEIDREELARLRADSAGLARVLGHVDMDSPPCATAYMTTDRRMLVFADKADAMEWEDCKDMIALYSMDELRRAIAQARRIPEGFALVPVEPTPEMLVAIVREAAKQESYWSYKPEQFYSAMLAAAPKGDSHE